MTGRESPRGPQPGRAAWAQLKLSPLFQPEPPLGNMFLPPELPAFLSAASGITHLMAASNLTYPCSALLEDRGQL